MQTGITTAQVNAKYSLQAAVKLVPSDVDVQLFFELVNKCLPGIRVFTEDKLLQVIALARNVQRLPATQREQLLSRASSACRQSRPSVVAREPKPDPLEREAWVKARVSEAMSWTRNLHKLGLASDD